MPVPTDMAPVLVPTSSFARPEVEAALPDVAKKVLATVAANCKLGPFTSTAGRTLPCTTDGRPLQGTCWRAIADAARIWAGSSRFRS